MQQLREKISGLESSLQNGSEDKQQYEVGHLRLLDIQESLYRFSLLSSRFEHDLEGVSESKLLISLRIKMYPQSNI